MQINFENLTIGVFAKAAGVNVETIRFYQRKGLLPEPDKPYGSIRRYGEADVTRVRFVKSAQRLGLAWTKSPSYCGEDGTHCEEARPGRAQAQGCAREDGRLWHAWRPCCLNWCAPAMRGRNVSCPLIASLQDGTKLAASARGVTG
jgi:MerR family mercuric resistance operon transcriptional regulator